MEAAPEIGALVAFAVIAGSAFLEAFPPISIAAMRLVIGSTGLAIITGLWWCWHERIHWRRRRLRAQARRAVPSARIVAGGGAGTQVTSRKGAQGAEVTSFVPILDAFAADDGALVAENASDVDESETDEFEAEMATRGGVIPSKRARSAASPRTLYRWERVWSRGRRAHGAKGKAQLWWIVLVGVLNTAIPYSLYGYSFKLGTMVGTAAVISGASPILATLLSHCILRRQQRIALTGVGFARRASGLGVGFVGIALLSVQRFLDPKGHGSASDTSVLNIIAGHLILVVAVFCKALASVLAHRHLSHVKLLPLALGQTAASAVAAVAAAFILNFTGVLPARHATQFKFFDLAPGRAYAAIMYLGLASSCAVYLLQFFLIQRAGAVRQLLVDYMTPVVGVVEGVAFRHELRNIGLSAGLCDIAGIACVAAGVALVTTQGGCCRRGYAGDAAALAEVTRPLSSTASRLQRHSAGKTTTGTTAIAGGGRSTSTATTGASAVVVAAVAASNRGVAGGGAATAINGGVAAAVGPSGGGGSGGSSVGIGRSWSGLLGSYEQGFVRKAATSIHGDV